MKTKIAFIGGHLTPAETLIQEFLHHEYDVHLNEMVFVGKEKEHGKKSVEAQVMAKYGVKFFNTWAVKMRRYGFLSFFSILVFPLTVVFNLFLFLKIRPKIVCGFGGYLSTPFGLAAKICGARLVIFEGTLKLGLANQVLARWADLILLAFENSRVFLAQTDKVHVVGQLLRQEILHEAPVDLKVGTILIVGGHQGAQSLNRAVKKILPQLLTENVVFHQVGALDLAEFINFKNELPKGLGIKYVVKDYFESEDYARKLANARLVISRSGVNAVCEIIYLHKKAVLVPFEFTQTNEQWQNAKLAGELCGAVLLEEKNLNSETLLDAINLAMKKEISSQSDVLIASWLTAPEKSARLIASFL